MRLAGDDSTAVGQPPPWKVAWWPRWCAAYAESKAAHTWVLRALLVYAVAIFVVRIHHAGDFAGYLLVGELVLRGEHPYRAAGAVNTWPPFFNVLCAPLAWFARPTPYLPRALWFVLNFACLWWILALGVRLVYQQRLVWRNSSGVAIAAPWVLVPLLCTDRYVTSNFDHVQINLVLLALVLAGASAQRAGQWGRGSVLIGLAAAIKVMPITFLGYLLYRRQWKSLLATAGATVAFSVSPIVVFGWSRFWDYVVAWRERVSAGWGVGRLNQSVWAMWDRWLGHGMPPFLTPGAHDIPSSGSPWVGPAVASTLVLVCAVAWWRWRQGMSTAWQVTAEWSFVWIATALFSPVTWKAYLAVMLLPNMLLFAAWSVATPGSTVRRLCGIGLAANLLTNFLSPGILGRELAARLEMACVPTVLALVVLLCVAWVHPHLGELERRFRALARVAT